MDRALPAERISELIGLVYDCAIDPALWPRTVGAISDDLDMYGGVLSLHSVPSAMPLLMVATGPYQKWPLDDPKTIEGLPELYGGVARVMQWPLDEPIQGRDAFVSQRPVGNPYYDRFLAPAGLNDSIIVGFARDSQLYGSVAWGRQDLKGPIGELEMSAMRLIAPHFRRAISISRLLDLKSVAARTFEAALDGLGAAVLLVDDKLGLVHANTAANQMLDAGDPVRLVADRIAFPHEVATNSIASAVALAARTEHDLGQRGIGVPVKQRSGEACVAHVLPLRVGEIRPGLNASAAAAIFIAPALAPPQLPGDALALLYDLTPAEARIFELIAAGETQADIASRLGIAAGTVKTHLLRVFQKTGCNRQADLVKLAGSLAMPY